LRSLRRILKIGHRGAAGHAPENTLASVEKGIALGADYVEVDIQRTLDGRLVLMHDKFVNRTTDGTGRLAELRWDELSGLDAGGGQRIPLLQQTLEAANGRVGLILESITPGIGPEVYRQVLDFGCRGPVIFSSFLHGDVLAIRELDAHVMTMALMEGVPISKTAFAREARVTHAGIALDSMTAEFCEALHGDGLVVFLYTADTEEQISVAAALGADGIISNFPERI
jgi:glycerophosphoryl diester phosphodiesterase